MEFPCIQFIFTTLLHGTITYHPRFENVYYGEAEWSFKLLALTALRGNVTWNSRNSSFARNVVRSGEQAAPLNSPQGPRPKHVHCFRASNPMFLLWMRCKRVRRRIDLKSSHVTEVDNADQFHPSSFLYNYRCDNVPAA